jgi:glucokinase
MQSQLSLVADIGGTNTRVALARAGVVLHDSVRRFKNADAAGLASVLAAFLTDMNPGPLDGACVAVAGPVRDGVGQLTNLDWRIDRAELGAVTGAARLAVLNDLQAQGHAVGQVDEADLIRLVPQPPASVQAARLVVGLGTGFNAAPIYDTAGGRFVPPSECGHITLPCTSPALAALFETLGRDHRFAAVEEALSGRGIVAVHAHLHGVTLTSIEIMNRLKAGDAAATETARLFIEALGTVMGDLALVHLPFGGIFLVGGMARAITPWLTPLGFADAFRAKGRFADFMDQFGIAVVTDDYAALLGCAVHLDHLPAA